MSSFYQMGNLTVKTDPLDDLCVSILVDVVEGNRKRQQDKWNILTNTRFVEEEQYNHWSNIASGTENKGNNLVHSQSNFPDLS